jgi:hypothetical protein
MDVVSTDELRSLVRAAQGSSVSLFLPTHRAGPDTRSFAQADLIRFKTLLREAEQHLIAAGVRARDATALLGPARALLDDAEFWRYQGDGLAVFVASDLFRTYRVPLALPELVVVGPRFHVKPLLALLTGDGVFYILALSQKAVRLFEATRDRVGPVDLGGVPRSLQEALRDDDPERQLQFHTGAPRRPARRDAVFHGHGVGVDDAKDRVLRFCQALDRGLGGLLRGTTAPLVLAGVEAVQAIYRTANTHPGLVDEGIAGNPEGLRPEDLHARGWPLVAPRFRQAREAAVASYLELRGTGRATGDLELAVGAALHGRVAVLFVPVGVQRWGRVDRDTGAVALHAEAQRDDEDLLNVAAVETLLSSGTVYAVDPDEMPDAAAIAAVLRY